MKPKIKKILKILLIVLSCLIVLLPITFVSYKYFREQQQIQDNINQIYNIYNSDDRQDIINEYPTTTNETTFGVPVISEENKEKTLNAIATLEIPSIKFKDIVISGTTQDSLAQGIGLFEHSNILEGNVCLAGHNSTRFFANLKNVKQGDIIKYSSCLGNKEYEITTIKQIEETDWSMLESTTDNRITIITCVKGQSNLRLCVQGIEIK